jgi:hypothetical protein
MDETQLTNDVLTLVKENKVDEAMKLLKDVVETDKYITSEYEKYIEDTKKLHKDRLDKCELEYKEKIDIIEKEYKEKIDIIEKEYKEKIDIIEKETVDNWKITFKNIEKLLIEDKDTAYKILYDLEITNKALFKALYEKYKFDDILHYILKNALPRDIKCFIENYKMNINCVNDQNESLLISAIKFGGLDLREYLIENGINLNIVDNKGNDAIFYAKLENYATTLKMIDEQIALNAKKCDKCDKCGK